MRVLQVHNLYRSALPSGENQVVEDDAELLRAAGVTVEQHLRSSDEIAEMGAVARLGLGLRAIHAPDSTAAVRRAISAARPDIVHLHNPYPLLSPSVVRAVKRAGVPIVQTIHNYRHTCLAGNHYLDGEVCRRCVDGATPLPGILHGCYQDSRIRSVPIATATLVHSRTWRQVDRFLAVSGFVGDWLVDHGVADRSQVSVRWNPVKGPDTVTPPGRGVSFAGRLDRQKGALQLVRAMAAVDDDIELTIAGDGPDRAEIESIAAADRRIRLLGLVTPEEVGVEMERAALVAVPSLWFEPAALVAAEAMAYGRPVLATRIGGLGDIVGDEAGWLVEPDERGIAEGLAIAARADGAELLRRGTAARARYEARHRPDRATTQLIDLYRDVIDHAGT